jgi:hypothetical protein
VTHWPAADEEVAAVAGVVEECAVAVEAGCVAAVVAAHFAVAEVGVLRWDARLRCRVLRCRVPQWAGHPAATSPVVGDQAHGPAVAAARIMETCRRLVVDQDRRAPAVVTWLVVERDLARGRVAATLPVDLAAHGRAVATLWVAALAPVRGPAGVRRRVIWETFLISPAREVAVRIVLVRVPRLRAAPRRSLPAVPQPISCKTDRQLSRVLDLAHALVQVT